MLRNRALRCATLVLLGACAGPAREPLASADPAALAPPPGVLGSGVFAGLFASLHAALDARETATARRIVDRILALAPSGETLAHAEAFEAIVAGREVIELLEPRLEGQLADGRVRLELAAEGLDREVVLEPSFAVLTGTWTAVDAAGVEERRTATFSLDALELVRLPAREPVRIALGEHALPVGRALASRVRFTLRLGGGTLSFDGRTCPAMNVSVEPCEIVRLAAFLPSTPVDPAELASYVQRPNIATPALLERTVRIHPRERAAALERLAPIALDLDRVRLAAIVPALRWLSGSAYLGADPDLWRGYLEERTLRAAETARAPLDLPEDLRAASPPARR